MVIFPTSVSRRVAKISDFLLLLCSLRGLGLFSFSNSCARACSSSHFFLHCVHSKVNFSTKSWVGSEEQSATFVVVANEVRFLLWWLIFYFTLGVISSMWNGDGSDTFGGVWITGFLGNGISWSTLSAFRFRVRVWVACVLASQLLACDAFLEITVSEGRRREETLVAVPAQPLGSRYVSFPSSFAVASTFQSTGRSSLQIVARRTTVHPHPRLHPTDCWRTPASLNGYNQQS